MIARGKRISPVSAQRARANRERRSIKARSHGPERCQWPAGCVSEGIDWDERLTRGRGGSATDVFNSLLLCRSHHDWKHAHPEAAQAMGIMPSAAPFVRPLTQRLTNDYGGGVPKRPVTFKVSDAGYSAAEDLAHEHHVNLSVIFRAMLSVAADHPDELTKRITLIKAAG